jgi:2-phosphosulfolactate phosphatase
VWSSVLAALAELGGVSESPEAEAARAAYETSDSIPDAVRASVCGAELVTWGFSRDVDLAVEIDTSEVVPVLRDQAFQSA